MALSIGGISSGLPTADIIEQLLAVERAPQVLMQRQVQTLVWKKQVWNEVNNKLLSLKSAVENLLNRDKLLLNKVTVSDDKALTVSASGMAASGEYRITIHKLATSTKLVSGSGEGLGIGGKVDPFAEIGDNNFGIRISKGFFTINGVQIEIEEGDILGTGGEDDTAPNSILYKINTSGAGVKATYDATTDRITIQAAEPGGAVNLGSINDTSNFLTATYLITAPGETIDGYTARTSTSHLGHINPRVNLEDANFATPVTAGVDGIGSFKINGVEIEYNIKEDTLNEIINRINYSDAGVTAFYDPLTDSFTLQNKKTGSFAITVEDVTGNLMAALNLDKNTTMEIGENASFTIAGFNNDQPIYSNTNEIRDIIPGLSFTLLEKTTEPLRVKVEQDVDGIKNVITNFINQYNNTVRFLNEKLKERKVTDKDWEDMTQAERSMGLLSGDGVLRNVRSNLLEQAIDPVEGADGIFKMLSSIGIESVWDGSGLNSGTLKIDDAKLTEAIRNNPDGVARLFFNDLDADGRVDRDSEGRAIEHGVAVRLLDYLDNLLDTKIKNGVKGGVIPRQQDELDSSIKRIQNRIDEFELRMEKREEQLVRQFTALERALAQMNAQSQWLAGQLAGLIGSN